jgi:probable phosphoglycerate mutase
VRDVSDLFCPVTVLAVRHADAEYDGSTMPGVPDGGRISDRGRAQVAALAERLRSRRVATVVSSPYSRAVDTARLLAEALDAPIEIADDLRELDAGELTGVPHGEGVAAVDEVFGRWLHGDLAATCPGGETGHQLVARFRSACEQLADRFRGETVVVGSHGGAMTLSLPLICGQSARELATEPLANTAVVELEGDADGWRLLHWPDRNPSQPPEEVPYPSGSNANLTQQQREPRG